MLEAFLIERFADGTNAAIHHVAGADQIRTGTGLRNGLLAQQGNGFIVEHDPFATDDSVMAIAGIGVQGDVRHDRHLGVYLLEAADRPGDQATFVEALRTVFGLQAIGHLREEDDATDPQVPGATDFLHESIQAPALTAGHRPDGLVAGPLMDKEGIDEVRGTQGGLPHHRPQGRGTAQAAGTVGELHRGLAQRTRDGSDPTEPSPAGQVSFPPNMSS